MRAEAATIASANNYGAVSVNRALTHLPEVPLGGWKESGVGTEGGVEILGPYQRTKHVNLR